MELELHKPSPADMLKPVKDCHVITRPGTRHNNHRPLKDIPATIAYYGFNEKELLARNWPVGTLGQMLYAATLSSRALWRQVSGPNLEDQKRDQALVEKYRDTPFRLSFLVANKKTPWMVSTLPAWTPDYVTDYHLFPNTTEAVEFIKSKEAEVASGLLQPRTSPNDMAGVRKAPLVLTPAKVKPSYLPVNERIELLEQSVDMVATEVLHAMIISGPSGLGKSHTVTAALKEAGLIEGETYTLVKGYSSPRGLYETLYKHNGELLVLDDCDSALLDKTAIEILKGALDSNDERKISWLISQKFSDPEIPTSFTYTGQCIFITNRLIHQLDQALRTRCTVIDLQMTREEILDRIMEVSKVLDFTPEVKDKALRFICINQPKIRNLSIRTLQLVLKLAKASPNNWEKLAEYSVTQ